VTLPLGVILLILFALFSAGSLCSEEPRRDVVVVTGTFDPVPLEESERPVTVLDITRLRLVSNSLASLLRLEPSVDVRERSPNGVQADVSIRGSTFGQTLVLLNGLRLNDPQSGHHNMDIPVPLESVARIEVLRGAGSTYYGSDAAGGVVNVITDEPEYSEFRLRSAVGNHGVNQQQGSLALGGGPVSQQFSFARDFSSGFRANRDYRNLSFASTTGVSSRYGDTRLLAAYNDRPFGAEGFYGNYPSWERTRAWFGSVQHSFPSDTQVAVAYRRHTDLFVLYRDRPEVFTNHHAAESYQAAVRQRMPLGLNAALHFGAEVFGDRISSTNLGSHGRTRGAGYVAFDARALQRFSLSLGIRDEIYRSGNHEPSPSAAIGFWVSPQLKLRAGVSRAFRLPSYTDLYYHDPANLGSPGLLPESAVSYEAGADWRPSQAVGGDMTVFHRRETDVIDYVRRSPADIWRATNFHRLRFTGAEAALRLRLARTQQIDLRYTALRGVTSLPPAIQTKYVFNYPVHSGVVSWLAPLPKNSMLRVRVGVLERLARDPYTLIDLYLAAKPGRIQPFVQATNMAGSRYEEIAGVAMPGRAILGGVQLVVCCRPK